MPENKLWFSLYTHKEYESTEPPFVDISGIKGIRELEDDYLVILKELEQYLAENNFKTHFNSTMVEKEATWKVQGLRMWGLENYKKQKHFKKTMALLNAIPNITLISFNLLEANSKIIPHQGDTNAVIRCHLGLKIPATEPDCAIKVKAEVKGWQTGKVLGFNDAFTHEAWNLTDETRLILLFDILKPQFIKQKLKVCATVRASLFIQLFGNRFPSIYHWNRNWFKIIAFPLIVIYQLINPLRNIHRKIKYN
jgi:ornithine lipid ester-linked acyl 2-hydroxylase